MVPQLTVPSKTIKYCFARGKNWRFDSKKNKKNNKKCRWPECLARSQLTILRGRLGMPDRQNLVVITSF